LSQKEIGELELKLQQAQNILKAISPDLDVDSPNLEAYFLSKLRPPGNDVLLSANTGSEAPNLTRQDSQHSGMEQDVSLETVLEETGQLDLDDQGKWSYSGHGSSSVFTRRLGERFGNVADSGLGKNTVLKLRSISPIDEAPRISEDQSFDPARNSIVLPPRDIAFDLISSALDKACALLKFVHEPSFYSMLDSLYLVYPEQYSSEQNKFLPLLYAVFAVGCLFSNNDQALFGNAHAVSQGFVNS
jgi:hypothetical protein